MMKTIQNNLNSAESYDPKIGANFIIEGIKYHYENFKNFSLMLETMASTSHRYVLENPDIINKMKHEAVAYINRIGQFYYFAKGIITEKKLGKLEQIIPTIFHFLPFRHKYGAHRAIDKPKGENPIWMNQLNRLFSTQALFIDHHLIFQIIDDDDKNSRHLDILEENEKIVKEAESLVSLVYN